MSYHIFVEPFTWILLCHYRGCLHSLRGVFLAFQPSAPPIKIRMLATYM